MILVRGLKNHPTKTHTAVDFFWIFLTDFAHTNAFVKVGRSGDRDKNAAACNYLSETVH